MLQLFSFEMWALHSKSEATIQVALEYKSLHNSDDKKNRYTFQKIKYMNKSFTIRSKLALGK